MDAHWPLDLDLQLSGISGRTDAPIGLTDEHEQLERLFRAAEGGKGQAIVIRGEAGSGKTTLLDRAVRSTSGFGVAHVAGLESERDLAFAALHRLCGPMLDRLDRLPGARSVTPSRQCSACTPAARSISSSWRWRCSACSRTPARTSRSCARWTTPIGSTNPRGGCSRPVACRIGAERIALVFTVREPTDHLGGLPELTVRPLSDHDAGPACVGPPPFPDRSTRESVTASSPSRGGTGACCSHARA